MGTYKIKDRNLVNLSHETSIGCFDNEVLINLLSREFTNKDLGEIVVRLEQQG
jgi:hypothetical protein